MIAIDWGSSTFRAFLVDAKGRIMDRYSSSDGVLTMFGKSYLDVIDGVCGRWLDQHGDLPIIMGGTVGSRNGWQEAPYIPCAASGSSLAKMTACVQNSAGRNIRIVPGVSGPNMFGGQDVMRGEEIQIFGALEPLQLRDALVCLPGTHSKWCEVKAGKITSVTSFMTGEIFALVRHHSFVGAVIEDTEFDPGSFRQGVEASASAAGLLHQLFSLRADALLGHLTCPSRESYLSGMLIGHEIDAAVKALGNVPDVLLVGGEGLNQRYETALNDRNIGTVNVSGEEAFVTGISLLKQLQQQKRPANVA